MSIFSRKRGGVELIAPFTHGQTGFSADPGYQSPMSPVIYDGKGGFGRRSRENGGVIYEIVPGWVSVSEFKDRKEARSRYWKKVKGPGNHAGSQRRFHALLERGGVEALYYGDGHPHEV